MFRRGRFIFHGMYTASCSPSDGDLPQQITGGCIYPSTLNCKADQGVVRKSSSS